MLLQYYFSKEHCAKLDSNIARYELSVPAYWKYLSPDKRQAAYNGIGPENFPACVRSLVTWFFYWFEEEAYIHDCEFSYSPRDYSSFTVANVRFLWNSLKEARRRYVTWNKFRPLSFMRRCLQGVLFATLCQLFGWWGYKRVNPDDFYSYEKL